MFEKKLPDPGQDRSGEKNRDVSREACLPRCGKYVGARSMPCEMLNDFKQSSQRRRCQTRGHTDQANSQPKSQRARTRQRGWDSSGIVGRCRHKKPY
jgi:hypothetical protein